MQTHGWVYNAVHSHVSDMVSKILRHFSRETSIHEFNWIYLHKDTFPNPQLTLSYNNGVLS